MAATSPRWIGAYRYFLLAYKRTWRGSLTTSFLYPVLYLAAIGLGLGKLVRDHGQVDGVSYVAFLAPGLLAATAMQIGTNEATFPVMAGIKWLQTYVAMLATPLEVGDVVTAVLAWIVTRVAIASGLFLGIMAAVGRNAAMAQFGRLRLRGFSGWLAWLFVHLLAILTLRGRLVVLAGRAFSYIWRDRPVRLIVGDRAERSAHRDAKPGDSRRRGRLG